MEAIDGTPVADLKPVLPESTESKPAKRGVWPATRIAESSNRERHANGSPFEHPC